MAMLAPQHGPVMDILGLPVSALQPSRKQEMARCRVHHAPCDDYGAKPGSHVPQCCPLMNTACVEDQCTFWLKGEGCMLRLALFGAIVAGADKVGLTHLLVNAHKQRRNS